jgi:hypothetical protein
MPVRLECDCGSIWQADIAEAGGIDPIQDMMQFVREHQRRGKYKGPVVKSLRTVCRFAPYQLEDRGSA